MPVIQWLVEPVDIKFQNLCNLFKCNLANSDTVPCFFCLFAPPLIPAILYLFEKESCQISVKNKTKHDYILQTLFKDYDAWGWFFRPIWNASISFF